MTTYRLDLKKTRKQSALRDLSEAEKRAILDYLNKYKDDDDVFMNVTKKYNASLTAVLALITNDELTKGVEEYETKRPGKSTTVEALEPPEEN